MTYDLHCHSNCSDGELTPHLLMQRAQENGARCLSITDHDTVSAYTDNHLIPPAGLRLVPGIELSTQWCGRGIHVVGLNIDLQAAGLREGIRVQQQTRQARAGTIASRLHRKGIAVSLRRVHEISGGTAIGRPHFAQHLVEIGAVKSAQQAFKKYLGAGKIGDIRRGWAELPTVVDWITGAGGIAVLAHPAHYRLTRRKLDLLIDDFMVAGGRAIEVISGNQAPQTTRQLADISVDKGLLASVGSDFHRPHGSWSDVGRVGVLPDACIPVWDHW